MRDAPDVSKLEGQARLAAAMRAIDFPTSRKDALDRVGGWRLLDDDEDAPLTVADLFAGMNEATFHDRARAAKEADHRFASIARSLAAVDRARPPR